MISFVQLPLPIHGASIANNFIINNLRSKEVVDIAINRNKYQNIFVIIWEYVLVLSKALMTKETDFYFTPSVGRLSAARDMLLILIGLCRKRRLVLHIHNQFVKPPQNFKVLLYRLIYGNKRNTIILLHPSLRSSYFGIFDNCAIEYLENVNFKESTPKDAISTEPEYDCNSTLRLLWYSNLMKAKGVIWLLENLENILFGIDSKVEIDIVGVDLEGIKDKVLTLIESRNDHIPNLSINYHESLPSKGRWRYFLFTSFNECYPLTVIEALMRGEFVISSEVGAVKHMINSRVGSTYLAGDAEDLNCVLRSVIDNIDNISSREIMEYARHRWNQENYLNRLNSILSDL